MQGTQANTGVTGALVYQGTWDANLNQPTLNSSSGTKGYFYVVSVDGNTNLDGITDWKVGDWAVFNGSIWEKVDNTDAVTSVNSQIGAVVLGLPQILIQNNTTGANDIIVNTGQVISWSNGGFTGSIQEGTFTGNQTYTLPDQSGTIALTSDIPALQNLASVLSVGNTTNGQNIVVDILDLYITTNNANPALRMAVQLFNDFSDYVVIGCDTFLPNLYGGKVFADPNNLSIGVYEGVASTGVSISFRNSDKRIILGRNNVASSTWEFYIKPDIDLTIGGTGGGNFTGLFKPTNLTGFRTYTFQDASGTVAFLSDIPSNAGNTLYVTDGALTGDRTVDTTANKYNVIFENTSTGDAIVIDASNRTILYSDGTFTGSLRTNIITGNRIWDLPDQSGTIALTSDIPASQDLASVLSVGNTTGANDIIMSTELGNRIIRSNPTTTANRFEIEFVDSGAMFLRRSSATDTGEVRLTTLGSQLNFLNNLGQFDTILTVNTGGVTLGTQTAVAKTFTLADEYSIVWNEASGGSNGSLTIPAPILTTNRTQSFQDADGVIALLSDIPALQNLNSVLAQGNTTGGRDIVMTGGDAIRTSSGGFPTDKRMRIQFNDNGGTFVDSIQIEAADPPPPGLPYSPRARATFSDTLLLGIWENNGLSRLQFQTTGDITVSSPNPTKLFTITNTYNLVLGTKTILPGTSGTLTLPAGSGTLALVSDVDQYKTGQVYSAVATVIDRTLDVNSTNLNEVANVLAILINDLKSVNILS